jgi:GNAT superfamily N-acetyltransferase
VSYERRAFVKEIRAFVADVLTDGRPWRAWVAEDANRLVGCVWLQLVERVPHPSRERWERPLAYVTNMYVEPDRRSAGLGRGLLEAAIAFAREREVGGILLWPSRRSVPFYERAGFGRAGAGLWLEIAGD